MKQQITTILLVSILMMACNSKNTFVVWTIGDIIGVSLLSMGFLLCIFMYAREAVKSMIDKSKKNKDGRTMDTD